MTIKLFTAVWWLMAFLHCYKGRNDIILSDVQVKESDVEDNEPISTEKFIPTTEWQVVKPNQAVPRGLHIRMNFQTGIKEAKLLEEDGHGQSNTNIQYSSKQQQRAETKTRKSTSTTKKKKKQTTKTEKEQKIIFSEENKPIEKFPQDNDKVYFTKNDLKHALHKFRDKVGTTDVMVDEITWSDDAKQAMEEETQRKETVKKKFRSIEEIKAELEQHMKIKVKSDVEIMKELIHDLVSSDSSINLKGAALDHLEYYVHQIDNGKDLDKLGGLEPIVLLLNSSSEEIQERAAGVIGAAAQSNKAAQDAFLRYSGLRMLLHMLNQETKSLTKKKGLFALSAVIRGNHVAQKELVKINGLEIIMNIIKEASLKTSLRVRGVTLLFDLIVEQNEVVNNLIGSGKMKSHERSQLLDLLVESDWCNTLPPLLKTGDLDTKEKVLQAMKISLDACTPILTTPQHLTELKSVLLNLQENIESEPDKDFKSYLEGLKQILQKEILEKLTGIE